VTGRRYNQLNYHPPNFLFFYIPASMVGGTGIEPVTSTV
jgi:hypothetical protein